MEALTAVTFSARTGDISKCGVCYTHCYFGVDLQTNFMKVDWIFWGYFEKHVCNCFYVRGFFVDFEKMGSDRNNTILRFISCQQSFIRTIGMLAVIIMSSERLVVQYLFGGAQSRADYYVRIIFENSCAYVAEFS